MLKTIRNIIFANRNKLISIKNKQYWIIQKKHLRNHCFRKTEVISTELVNLENDIFHLRV